LLDPGLAFGTGTHPTTALCLEWLATAKLQGLRIIDYGCGSGILAIAAAKLGARLVWAVDNDPQALQATRVNAEKNGVAICEGEVDAHLSPGIFISLPDDRRDFTADLLLANILARPLIEFAAYFATLVRPERHIILSGILAGQVEDVRAAYATDFVLAPPVIRDGWARLEGRRKSAMV
ncbi:MAG: 50S ribosomal protein L11 methyltransferase, partial [Gammaproteobacteria bacterium]